MKKYLQILSEDVLGSCGGRTVLLQFLSFHVVYHLHELQFIQYRELGRIFDELHQIVLEKLSEEVQEVCVNLCVLLSGVFHFDRGINFTDV